MYSLQHLSYISAGNPEKFKNLYEGDFLHAIQTNNYRLMRDLKLSKKDSNVVANFVAELSNLKMMKILVEEKGIKYDVESICTAINEGKIEMAKYLLMDFHIDDNDLQELAISYEIALEEKNLKAIHFLENRFNFKK